MATGITNTTTSAAFVPEKWARTALIEFEKALVLAALFNNVTGLFGADGGDTLNLPVLGAMNRTAVKDIPQTTGATFTPEAGTSDEVTLVIDKHKYASVELSDPLKVFANQDLEKLYSGRIGYALADYVDYDFSQVYSSTAHSAVDLSGISSLTDKQVVQGLSLALEYFQTYNVPLDGCAFVVDPVGYGAIRANTYFASADYANGKPIATGLVGTIFGRPVFLSTNLRTSANASGTTVTHCMLVHRDAIYWADPKPISILHAPGDGRNVNSQMTGKLYYGWISAPKDGTNNYMIVDIQVSR